MKTAIIICALNEEKNLRSVLDAATPFGTVFLIDDGSKDATSAIARECGAQVIVHPVNLGQGLSTITGFNIALKGDYEAIVEMDGDGQHDATEIPKFIECLDEKGVDIVVGSRILGSNYDGAPWARRFFLPKLTGLINLITGYKMTDSMCGFRAFKADSLRRALPELLRIREPQYIAAERFIRFSRLGLTLAEIPIHMSDRSSGISSTGLFRYGWGVARGILLTLLEGRD